MEEIPLVTETELVLEMEMELVVMAQGTHQEMDHQPIKNVN